MRPLLTRIHGGQLACFLLVVLTASSVPLHVVAQPLPVTPAAGGHATANAVASGVVNLNTASGDELERLPGIGPTRARAILELRTRLKHFLRIEDLLRVKGIGRATFRRLRALVTLEGPTTLTQ